VTTWHDHEKAHEYVGRIGTVPQRLAGEAALAEFLPPAPRRALDLGCGDGRLVRLVLEHCPDIEEVVGVDNSPPMLEAVRANVAGDARVTVVDADLREPLGAWGRFDLVTTGFAVHHLPDDRKQTLLTEVVAVLEPGGTFANLEVVESATPELHEAFTVAIGKPGGDLEDLLSPMDVQLDWMRAAGLEQVDCMWKWRGFALMVGKRPV
jgi:tRNA (cmo5U34)-methyltransferase